MDGWSGCHGDDLGSSNDHRLSRFDTTERGEGIFKDSSILGQN